MSTPEATRTTGIVVALAAEAGTLTSHTTKPGQVIALTDGAALCLSGMGPIAAQRAAEMLIDAGATALAVFGVAGALSTHLRNGALFCPECVLDEKGHTYYADLEWHIRLQQRLAISLPADGALLSVASPLLTAADKADAHQRYEALAVDMETSALYRIAAHFGVRALSLLTIVDNLVTGEQADYSERQALFTDMSRLAFEVAREGR